MKTARIDKGNRKEARKESARGFTDSFKYKELEQTTKYWLTFRKQESARLRAAMADVIYASSESIPTT